MTTIAKNTICIWYDGDAEEAARFYAATFPDSRVDAVHRAQPFGPAPGAIVSPDGNVYLHWEFHRDEVYACSTMHARPFLLNTPPKSDPAEPQPPGPAPKSPSQEKGAPPPVNIYEKREGALPARRDDVRG